MTRRHYLKLIDLHWKRLRTEYIHGFLHIRQVLSVSKAEVI